MANKYLDDQGTLYFWQKIKAYFASIVPTKQSDLINDDNTVKDADYSTYKNKIDSLEDRVDDIVTTGGEPNVIENVAVNGTDLTITSKRVNVTVTTGSTNGSISVNGSDVSVNGLGTAAYMNANSFDPSGAASTVLGTVSDTAGTATVYGALASASTAQSGVDAINSAGYQTSAQVSAAIASAIQGISGISYELVSNLPASGSAGTIYLVPNSGSSPNIYDEYIWVNNAFEKIGTTDVDLSGYMLTTDMIAITNAEIDTITAPSSGS